MIAWIGRFRFVTVALVAERFGVSVQMTGRRLARLEAGGLLVRARLTHADPFVVFLTPAGARRVGLAARRAPRVGVQREHELAIAWLTSRLERTTDHLVVTERECRAWQLREEGRFSVRLYRPVGRGDRVRWPDLVVTGNGRRVAVEIEFAPKGSARLAAIVHGYLHSGLYDEVRFLLSHPATAGRLVGIAGRERARAGTLMSGEGTQIVLSPWPGCTPGDRALVQAAIDDAAVERR